MLELGSEFKGLIDEQISGLLTPKFLITDLDIGGGETVTDYQDELSKAKLIIFFLKTSGASSAHVFYMKTASTEYNKYCIGNHTNAQLGIYIRVTSDGNLATSTYQYDGFTTITGFATFY